MFPILSPLARIALAKRTSPVLATTSLTVLLTLASLAFGSATGYSNSLFALRHDPDRPRSDIGMPFVSFLLPGFDQWWEGQSGSAAVYTGVALGGILHASSVLAANDIEGDQERREQAFEDADEEYQPVPAFASDDVALRRIAYGQQLYQTMGGLSAYHSFRSAVRSRRGQGQYSFLRHEETTGEIMLAPLEFSYLSRSTTWIPLSVVAALTYFQATTDPPEELHLEKKKINGADVFFASAFSLNAGTHEEAMFRGWLMPVFREYVAGDFAANGLTSILFALAHLDSTPIPLVQLLLGYHLGYVTLEDQWRLGEAVFIHTWWDVFAFLGTYHYRQKLPEEEAAKLNPILWLPPLVVKF